MRHFEGSENQKIGKRNAGKGNGRKLNIFLHSCNETLILKKYIRRGYGHNVCA